MYETKVTALAYWASLTTKGRRDLASSLGVSSNHLCSVVNRSKTPTLELAAGLAKATGGKIGLRWTMPQFDWLDIAHGVLENEMV